MSLFTYRYIPVIILTLMEYNTFAPLFTYLYILYLAGEDIVFYIFRQLLLSILYQIQVIAEKIIKNRFSTESSIWRVESKKVERQGNKIAEAIYLTVTEIIFRVQIVF